MTEFGFMHFSESDGNHAARFNSRKAHSSLFKSNHSLLILKTKLLPSNQSTFFTTNIILLLHNGSNFWLQDYVHVWPFHSSQVIIRLDYYCEQSSTRRLISSCSRSSRCKYWTAFKRSMATILLIRTLAFLEQIVLVMIKDCPTFIAAWLPIFTIISALPITVPTFITTINLSLQKYRYWLCQYLEVIFNL